MPTTYRYYQRIDITVLLTLRVLTMKNNHGRASNVVDPELNCLGCECCCPGGKGARTFVPTLVTCLSIPSRYLGVATLLEAAFEPPTPRLGDLRRDMGIYRARHHFQKQIPTLDKAFNSGYIGLIDVWRGISSLWLASTKVVRVSITPQWLTGPEPMTRRMNDWPTLRHLKIPPSSGSTVQLQITTDLQERLNRRNALCAGRPWGTKYDNSTRAPTEKGKTCTAQDSVPGDTNSPARIIPCPSLLCYRYPLSVSTLSTY